VVWCEVEMIISLGRELESFWQAVDCYALERSSFDPLGEDLAVGCDALESFSSGPLGKDLLACSKKRAAGDASVQEFGVFGKLDIFEEWWLPSVAVSALFQSPVDVGVSMGCLSVGLASNPFGRGGVPSPF
jgi:hypothetical protein